MFSFDRFTEKANNALNHAIGIAEELGHTFVGSEHITYGLISEKSGVAAAIISKYRISEEMFRQKLIEVIGHGMPTTLSPNNFTPRTKRVLEMAVSEARNLGHNYIGTEHILMAVLREGESYGVLFLHEMGVEANQLYSDCQLEIGKNSGFSGVSAGMNKPNSRPNKSNKNTANPNSTLYKYGRDLTEMAENNQIDPVIGRQDEIERVIQILSRRTKNNPCLIGEPGVGKTAIAEGLAQKISQGEVPEILKSKRIITLDLTSMVAGAKYRGDFEERIKNAIDEVVKSGDIILFIDEMHTLIGAGAAEGAIDAANILKPKLARGELQVIGATTTAEYRKHIEKDAALERRFQSVTVSEPSPEDAVSILMGLRDKYEAHHKVQIGDDAITAAVQLSTRYINDRFLPDKAIDLVDEAASRVKLKTYTAPPELRELEEEIKKLSEEMSAAINAQDFESAARLRDKDKKLRDELEKEKQDWQEKSHHSKEVVTEKEVAEIVSLWTGIPVVKLTETESERLLNMEKILHEKVIGQDEAVSAVSRAIRRGRVGLKDPKRPTGSFIFLGPTGVGKTELCKALAESLFGDENSMIRLDMSEYMEKHSVSKMIGSPPGYVGFDDGGQLTEKIRRKPYSVVLFDEIEKAHPDTFNILLQILEDGILTDSQGRKVDFRNSIIIMTSNVGARSITERKNLGFSTGAQSNDEQEYNANKSEVMSELKKHFKPEFLNRVDDIIVFHKLKTNDVEDISRKMLENLSQRMEKLGINLSFSDETVSEIARIGFDPLYGARPLRRAITSNIEDMISEKILEKKIKSGDNISLIMRDNKFDFVLA